MYNIGMLGRKGHAPQLWVEGQGLFLPFFFFNQIWPLTFPSMYTMHSVSSCSFPPFFHLN